MIQKQEAARKQAAEEEAALKKAAEEKAAQAKLRQAILKEKPSLDEKKHSSAKAAGLKSTFLLPENRLLMTAFGKGNEAIPEKLVAADEIFGLNQQPMFSA